MLCLFCVSDNGRALVFLTNCTVFIAAAVQTIETSFDIPNLHKSLFHNAVEYASEEQNDNSIVIPQQ